MNFPRIFFPALKMTIAIFCLALFFFLMMDVWAKYESKMTHIGIQTIYHEEHEKELPCITICPIPGFKSRGFFFDDQSFDQNTVNLVDIFEDKTLAWLNNASEFRLIKIRNILHGKCFTICPIYKCMKKVGPMLMLKPSFQAKVFVHTQEAEFWLNGMMEPPFDLPFEIIDESKNAAFAGVLMSLAEVETVSVSKDRSPCRHYSDESSVSEMFMFIDCCRKRMSELFPKAASCQIPGFDFFQPQNSTLQGCQNQAEAKKILLILSEFTNDVMTMPESIGCPLPCRMVNYKVKVEPIGGNVLDAYDSGEDGYFFLQWTYRELSTEEHIETYDYDGTAFWASVGGNLGLFLGFSCLSVLFAAVEAAEKYFGQKLT